MQDQKRIDFKVLCYIKSPKVKNALSKINKILKPETLFYVFFLTSRGEHGCRYKCGLLWKVGEWKKGLYKRTKKPDENMNTN